MVAVRFEMGIFEGHPNRRVFSHNIDLLQRQQYRLAGQLTTWSLANGGPGLNCLSKYVCSLMMGLHIKDDLHDAVNDIDVESKDIICQVSCCKVNFTVFRVDNFATIGGTKVCPISKFFKYYPKDSLIQHVSDVKYSLHMPLDVADFWTRNLFNNSNIAWPS